SSFNAYAELACVPTRIGSASVFRYGVSRSRNTLVSGSRWADHFLASGSSHDFNSACRRSAHTHPYGRSKDLLPSSLKNSSSPLIASSDRCSFSFSLIRRATGRFGCVRRILTSVQVEFTDECQSKQP